MFYKTDDNNHSLPHDPFKSCVAPRPIGWISSVSSKGIVNLAPYSFYNAVSSNPPIVMYANSGAADRRTKDTLANILETKEFVANMATWDLKDQMNISCTPFPPEVDEIMESGLSPAPSELVAPPRVKESPISLECVLVQTVELPCTDPGGRNTAVFGQVVGIHIHEDVMTEGLIDITKLKPISRLGYQDYALIDNAFTMKRPKG
ncbi:MAG: flavin reductase family protein [Rhodospirillales bacterium]|nr:flavin reductase family protein [Rhodospirillales bacterium]